MMQLDFKHHIVLTLSIFFLFLNCDTRFEGNTRIAVEGLVVDTAGNAIEGAEISVYATRSTGSFLAPGPSGSNQFLLGRNYSDANGNFAVVSLFDNGLDIVINAGDDYSRYVYANYGSDYIPPNNSFNLENVTLNNLAVVNYSITRTSGEGNSISFTLNYTDPDCSLVYIDGVLNEAESNCNSTNILTQTLNDNVSETNGSLSTIVGSTLEFVYSLNGAPEITETVSVDAANFQFNFTY